MNVGEAARVTGLPTKTVRFYDEAGLVCPVRQANGYRHYRESDVQKLQFLKRARSLGFSIENCRDLMSLYADRDRASGDVKAIAEAHLGEIDEKIRHLQSLRDTLEHLVHACHGDNRPDCPILKDLASPDPA